MEWSWQRGSWNRMWLWTFLWVSNFKLLGFLWIQTPLRLLSDHKFAFQWGEHNKSGDVTPSPSSINPPLPSSSSLINPHPEAMSSAKSKTQSEKIGFKKIQPKRIQPKRIQSKKVEPTPQPTVTPIFFNDPTEPTYGFLSPWYLAPLPWSRSQVQICWAMCDDW